jgi:surfactin synthase thioesterase subunit
MRIISIYFGAYETASLSSRKTRPLRAFFQATARAPKLIAKTIELNKDSFLIKTSSNAHSSIRVIRA